MLHTSEIFENFLLSLRAETHGVNTEANIGTIVRARKLERVMKGTSTPPNKLKENHLQQLNSVKIKTNTALSKLTIVSISLIFFFSPSRQSLS